MKRYDAWSEPDPQCGYGGGRCELYERTLGQYVEYADIESMSAALHKVCEDWIREGESLEASHDAMTRIYEILHPEENAQ